MNLDEMVSLALELVVLPRSGETCISSSVVTSIWLIRCLCYKPERIRTSDMSTCLTLSNIKRGMDLGTLVVPFDQTFHLFHKWCKTQVPRLDLPNTRHIGPLFVNFRGTWLNLEASTYHWFDMGSYTSYIRVGKCLTNSDRRSSY